MGIALLVISLRRAESFLVRCLLLVLSLEPSLIDTMRGVVSTSFVRSFVFGLSCRISSFDLSLSVLFFFIIQSHQASASTHGEKRTEN